MHVEYKVMDIDVLMKELPTWTQMAKPESEFAKLMLGDSVSDVKTKAVVCFAHDDALTFTVGVSLCSVEDEFDITEGKALALTRAKTAPIAIVTPKLAIKTIIGMLKNTQIPGLQNMSYSALKNGVASSPEFYEGKLPKSKEELAKSVREVTDKPDESPK